MRASATLSAAAVTPEPQLVTIGRSRSTPAASKRRRNSSGFFISPVDGSLKVPNGTLKLPGMRPETTPGPRFRRGAAKTLAGARVDHLLGLAGKIGRDLRPVAHQRSIAMRRERNQRMRRPLRSDLAAIGAPFLQAAVEDADVATAEGAKRPPHARRAHPVTGVIDHDPVRVADAERADIAGERVRRRQHMRQDRRTVGDGVDVEEHRARNMCGGIILRRGRRDARHLVAAVDKAQRRVGKVGLQPRGRDKNVVWHHFKHPLRGGCGHGSRDMVTGDGQQHSPRCKA